MRDATASLSTLSLAAIVGVVLLLALRVSSIAFVAVSAAFFCLAAVGLRAVFSGVAPGIGFAARLRLVVVFWIFRIAGST